MFKMGQKVRFTSERKHRECPEFYPPVGWVGEITKVCNTGNTAAVEWGKDSGVNEYLPGCYEWWSNFEWLEAVDDE